jgi:hypothetical protein
MLIVIKKCDNVHVFIQELTMPKKPQTAIEMSYRATTPAGEMLKIQVSDWAMNDSTPDVLLHIDFEPLPKQSLTDTTESAAADFADRLANSLKAKGMVVERDPLVNWVEYEKGEWRATIAIPRSVMPTLNRTISQIMRDELHAETLLEEKPLSVADIIGGIMSDNDEYNRNIRRNRGRFPDDTEPHR